MYYLMSSVTKDGNDLVRIRDISGNEGFMDEKTKIKDVKERTAADMKKDLRGWGFGLIVLGIAHFVLAGFLDPAWGVVLIVIGVLAILVKQRGMFIMIGIALLLAGIMNIGAGGEFGGWTIFGFLQLYWGVQEIRKFWKYALMK